MDLDEARKSGVLTVYTDTDPELERAAKEYNQTMSECRFKMKRVRELEFAYFVLNPVVTVGLLMLGENTASALSDPVPMAALIAFAAVFLYFSVAKKKPVVPTAVSVLLLLIDIRFAILTAADIVITVWHTALLKPLKLTDGYPVFSDIAIKYERFAEGAPLSDRFN